MLAAIDVAYAVEALDDALWAELTPLIEKHYQEVEHYRDIALAPDREAYARIQANNGLRVFTARKNNRLIGYLAVFVHRNLHARDCLMAYSDVFFLHPDYRGSRAGMGLLAFAHTHLRSEGVRVLFMHSKHRNNINIGHLLARFFAYEHVDDLWAVRLDQMV